MNNEILLVFWLGGQHVICSLEFPASDDSVVGAGQEDFVFWVLEVEDVEDYGLGGDY